MTERAIRVEVADFIAVLTLDRPPVNALATQTYEDVTWAFDAVKERQDVRVVILTGAGDRAFCAGADVKEVSGHELAQTWDRFRKIREAFWSIYECPVPVVGAINGVALGGGLCLAACCDVLIASERAIFGLPEIDVGLLGGCKLLQRLVPQMKARKMVYTGERIDAREAYRLGMVDKVVPHDQLKDEARKLAQWILSKSPVAIRFAKRALNEIEFMTVRDGTRHEQWYAAELRKHEDSREAALAFVEKRAPVFKGK